MASRNQSKAATPPGRNPVIFGLNELTPNQRDRVVRLVRDGLSLRAIERLTGHRRETVSRYARREGFDVRRRLKFDEKNRTVAGIGKRHEGRDASSLRVLT